MSLPDFSIATPLSTTNARQDKIDLKIDLGSIQLGDYHGIEPDDYQGFKDAVWLHFSGPPKGTSSNQGYHSEIFDRGTKAKRVLKVLTKQKNGSRPGALFGGSLIFTWNTSSMSVGLRFDGYLNATRYVRHQGASPQGEGQNRFTDATALMASLFRHDPNADGRTKDEFSLDGADNWIPDVARANSFAAPWSDRQQEYLEAVHSLLQTEIQRVCGLINFSGNPVSWNPPTGWEPDFFGGDVSLQRVETYWEFKHGSPLQQVKQLEADLRAYCSSEVVRREFRGREDKDGQLQFTREKNCILLDAEVAPGIHLVIYAKTNQRIRFEVRHYLPELTNRRGIAQTCSGVAGTCEGIASISEDAADVMNRFFSFLRSRVDFVPASNSPLDFLFECAECAEKPIYGDSVVRMILSTGTVTRLPALKKTIKAMERANILERVENEQAHSSESFVVTPRYRDAVEVLRRLDAENPITGIVRRRRARTPPSMPNQ